MSLESARPDAPGVIGLPPLIYVLGLAAGVAIHVFVPVTVGSPAVARPLGLVLAAIGALLAGWFLVTMRRAGTAIDVSKPASKIVRHGPFRFSRNPGYLSLTLAYGGLALLVNTAWAFLTLLPTLLVIQKGVIEREERYLERKFGRDYLDYKAGTRRWI